MLTKINLISSPHTTCLVERWLHLFTRFRKLQVKSPVIQDSGLSLQHISYLNCIHNNPGCRVMDVARNMNLTPPTVSVVVRQLISDGWLERKSDPDDRRVGLLFSTQKTQDLIFQLNQQLLDFIQGLMENISEEDQEKIISLLETAVQKVEQNQKMF